MITTIVLIIVGVVVLILGIATWIDAWFQDCSYCGTRLNPTIEDETWGKTICEKCKKVNHI